MPAGDVTSTAENAPEDSPDRYRLCSTQQLSVLAFFHPVCTGTTNPYEYAKYGCRTHVLFASLLR